MARTKEDWVNPLNIELDGWQKKVMRRQGNIALRCGRQTGKSTIISLKAHQLAMNHPDTLTLVTAPSQRQASLLYEKIRSIFELENERRIDQKLAGKKFKTDKAKKEARKEASIFEDDPTMTRIKLKNGSSIYCLPSGRTGATIRGFTVDFLIVDEAPLIPHEVWVSITPMLATSQKQRGTGWKFLLGTPKGKKGYFYQSFKDKTFLHVHVRSTQCPRISKRFLAKEKRQMTREQYKREYLAEWVSDYLQYFPEKALDLSFTLPKNEAEKHPDKDFSYYLGVDVARYGSDQTAFYITALGKGKTILGLKAMTTEKEAITETVGRIIKLHEKWNFKRIFVDGGGVGGGVIDFLIEKLGKKIVDLNNAKTAESYEKGQPRKLMKEDLYSNALVLMEQQGEYRIQCTNENKTRHSLESISYEFTSSGNFVIKKTNNRSHIAEAFVRACWCWKNKGLRLFVA